MLPAKRVSRRHRTGGLFQDSRSTLSFVLSVILAEGMPLSTRCRRRLKSQNGASGGVLSVHYTGSPLWESAYCTLVEDRAKQKARLFPSGLRISGG